MADVSIKYKGSAVAEMSESGSKTLKTSGKYCESDIVVEYTAKGSGIPEEAKIKYIIPATYLPARTSDDNGFDVTTFTFTRENVNQLSFVDWRLQDETNFNTNGVWVQDIIWDLHYQGNYNSKHNFDLIFVGAGNKGNHSIMKYYNFDKTALTGNFSLGNNTTTDAAYKRHGTTYKGLIFIYDSTYNGSPIVDETKLTQFFTNCNLSLQE
jgi:hypothetical protein